ncbi:uncharacterized protein [Chelonus insularis]|uniref:uncharacterized protein isoform X2 n=1 Tax=Chelonus insularis TaxID=460826 RepID=UPI001588652E|nr:uncharacterized protein LOC118072127 isoform X2 [Chelonus insularis]
MSQKRKIEYSTFITNEKKLNGSDIWKKDIPRYNSASNLAWPPRNQSQDLMKMNIKKEKVDATTESSDFLALNELKISDHKSVEKNSVIKTEKILSATDVSSNTSRPAINYKKPSLLIKENVEHQGDSNKSNIQNKILDYSQVKKNLRSLIPQEVIQESSQSKKRYVQFGIILLVSFIALIFPGLLYNTKEMPFDFTNVSLELQNNVLGQDEAMNQLLEHFYHNADNFSVVVFIGGTGVGKSFTKEIIVNHFPHPHNVFEYTPPLQDSIVPAYDALSNLQCNLVILENLKSNHLEELIEFVKYFNDHKERPCVIILAIINPQTIDDHLVRSLDLNVNIKKVENLFSQENIPVKIIGFKCLSLKVIDACIEKEARKNNIKLSGQQFEEVRKSLVTANSGCKGAYAKVQLYMNSTL